jgi:hypothetical protein
VALPDGLRRRDEILLPPAGDDHLQPGACEPLSRGPPDALGAATDKGRSDSDGDLRS